MNSELPAGMRYEQSTRQGTRQGRRPLSYCVHQVITFASYPSTLTYTRYTSLITHSQQKQTEQSQSPRSQFLSSSHRQK